MDQAGNSLGAPLSRRKLATLAATSLALAAAPAVAFERPDAELLRLGEEFERAWAEQQPLWDALEGRDLPDEHPECVAAEEASEEVRSIVNHIEHMPARTLAGFRVKARCIEWCHAGNGYAGRIEIAFNPRQPSTDDRLANSILNGLLELTI